MEVIVVGGAKQIGRLGADAVEQLVRADPEAVLGLATGSSPLSIYDELATRVAAGRLSLARCRAFMLDEYVGLSAEHPERYRNVIERDLVARTDLDSTRVHGPDGLAADVDVACADYERQIRDSGGVGLQILGVGTDGHIAFNEPGSSLASRTRIKTLTRQTRQDNARFFGDDVTAVPQHCLTQGVGTIMSARHLLLVASGRGKAEAIHQIVEGPITAMWPGSILQMHPHVTVIIDQAAASRLQLKSYFEETWASKPTSQGF